ncbi:MAG: antitermination protein [Pelagibacteraceae bacterium]|jgi:N utilization substance protein B|nr:antitermination protein [Pelagibacteraceae bacterium]MBO6483406.1 antitermination protein [Pelagibacteraceae bacterium]
MDKVNPNNNPRIIVVQKLYSHYLNRESELIFPKHRYKKFIKDTVLGTIEREELLLENLKTILKDEFNPSRTDLILKLMILSATFELMFSHKTPTNVVVSEYVKISDFFLETAHKGYLNAILDKISKNVRKNYE